MRWSGLAIALAFGLVPLTAAAQVDGSFDYRTERVVSGGSGTYAGWNDSLRSTGHYDVVVPADDAAAPVRVHAIYQWRYSAPENPSSGTEDRHVEIDRTTRAYRGQTDLDDYDDQADETLQTWIWIPVTSHPGAGVTILGESFEVESVDAMIDVAGAPRHTIHLHRADTGGRHDDYGDFQTRYTDDYWFDRTTGLFLRELRVESDANAEATFVMREEAFVVDATYAPRVGELPADPMLSRDTLGPSVSMLPPWGIPAMVGGVILVAFFGLRRLFQSGGPRPVTLRGAPVVADKLGPNDRLPPAAGSASNWFAAFLPHFVDVARRTDNAVYTCTIAGKVEGVAIDDRLTGVASIFAHEPDVCEVLRKSLGRNDFFSEMRHGNLASVIGATAVTGDKLPAAVAYNVLETYEVLQLDAPSEPAYDNAVVSRFEETDRDAAAHVLTEVLGNSCRAYLEAALAAGDIAYVARAEGAIVGVGLATVVGDQGRLHTLAVSEAYRNRGLGRELVRARIRAMATLGAKRIVTEVSTRNAASLEIVRGEGFRAVGTMYVESARDTAPITTGASVRL